MAVSAGYCSCRRDLKRLNTFQHRCVCTVLGITNQIEAVGGAHLFSGSERAVGKCGDKRDQTDATSSSVTRIPCQDAGL